MSHKASCRFEDHYIEHLVDYLSSEYLEQGKDLGRLAVVFGGKRPALFVKRALAKRIKRPFVPPVFLTIDELITRIVREAESFRPTADLDGLYALYQLAKSTTPQILKGRESFAQFLPWAREILAFIDQLDLEHVSNDRLRHIEANAQIGYEVPKDINVLLESIVRLREAYHAILTKENMYSRGFQYYRAAQLIEQVKLSAFDRVLFCNFFYFNRSEEKVAQTLYERGQAVFLFQGDERKWPILKRIAQRLSLEIQEGEEVKEAAYALRLHAGFDAHSQVGLVREIVRNIKHPDKAVIVLPNPDQVVPLLAELTDLIDDFNVSMGYPLKRSSLYSLMDFIFRAQLSRKGTRYYAKDYLKVIRHPFIKNLKLSDQPAITRILIHKIEEALTGKLMSDISGSSFVDLKDIAACEEIYDGAKNTFERMAARISVSQLRAMVESIHQLLFTSWESVQTFSVFSCVLRRFLDDIVAKSFLQNYPLNINIIERMYDMGQEFEQAHFCDEVFTAEDIFKIFDGKISREVVAFVGSPLKGLQILGLFETRSLNFDHVIIMDVNEGALPRLNVYEPLIPREVMISLNLDRLEFEEEIQRYQFLRLISSAKQVHLIYQESKDKERSRFVEELVWHHQKKQKGAPGVPVERSSFKVDVASWQQSIPKTKDMVDVLKKHTFSASSINTYLRDPVEFYYRYVLGIKEQDDLLDEPEARHVGTFLHELLEEAYQPFLGKQPKINATFRKRVMASFEAKFDQTFRRMMRSDSVLLYSILEERIQRFLDHEEKSEERALVSKVLYVEKSFEDTLVLPCGPVKFKYIVDRVDELKDGSILILDYKTGSIDQMPCSPETLAGIDLNRESIYEHVKSFQLPLYFYFFDKQFKDKPINAGLYSLRTMNIKKFLKQDMRDRSVLLKAYLGALDAVVREIWDVNVPFETQETAYA